MYKKRLRNALSDRQSVTKRTILALLNEHAKLPCELGVKQNNQGLYKIEPYQELSLAMVAGLRAFISGYLCE